MDKSKWTPGPWILDGRSIRAGRKTQMAVPRVLATVYAHDALGEADACLIAAAPQLAEALRDLESAMGGCSCSRTHAALLAAARAALATAEGKR